MLPVRKPESISRLLRRHSQMLLSGGVSVCLVEGWHLTIVGLAATWTYEVWLVRLLQLV